MASLRCRHEACAGGVIGVTVGFAIGTVGHLFQPGTLRDDFVAGFRHPIWSVRAEGQRIFARPT